MPPRRGKSPVQRQQVAAEAARLLARRECPDIPSARRKAARQVGCHDRRSLPDNREIEQALIAYQQLFQRDSQSRTLERLRRTAAEAMRQLQRFDPHLIGPVLSGSAGDDSPVSLQLYADTPEQVVIFLLERHIPFQQREQPLQFADGSRGQRPLLRFLAGEEAVELIVLPPGDRCNPPLDQVTAQPARGARLAQVQALLEETREAEGPQA